VLIEAALVGTPCVATDVGGVRELVDDGRAALLVPPRDPEKLGRAIEELLSDPDRQQQLRSAARAHMESRHTLHVVARQWDEELTRLARR
jgi:glycosyltransferase involved in cell wall biosynthesis